VSGVSGGLQGPRLWRAVVDCGPAAGKTLSDVVGEFSVTTTSCRRRCRCLWCGGGSTWWWRWQLELRWWPTSVRCPPTNDCSYSSTDMYCYIAVARILSGGALALKKRSKSIFKSNPPSKNVLKIDSCSGWGCTSCPGGALTHFPCKLRLKKLFHRPVGVQVHPLHPLAIRLCTVSLIYIVTQ